MGNPPRYPDFPDESRPNRSVAPSGCFPRPFEPKVPARSTQDQRPMAPPRAATRLEPAESLQVLGDLDELREILFNRFVVAVGAPVIGGDEEPGAGWFPCVWIIVDQHLDVRCRRGFPLRESQDRIGRVPGRTVSFPAGRINPELGVVGMASLGPCNERVPT